MLEVCAQHRLGDFSLDIDFKLETPGLAVLMGPSGAGKSLTLNIIAGVLRAQHALVRFKSVPMSDTARAYHMPPHLRRIALVQQEAHLFPHLSVEANLRYGLKRRRDGAFITSEEVVKILRLEHLLGRKTLALSGGERQRINLGRALLSQPQLLLLDEPVSALNAELRTQVLDYIYAVQQKFALPMLMVTHTQEDVRGLAQQVISIEAGKIAAAASAAPRTTPVELRGQLMAQENGQSLVQFGKKIYILPPMATDIGAAVCLKFDPPAAKE
jgi:molybdate transport system ATP-binding protein